MGTRAQFFVGNPEDLANRVWLGCIAFDGYPDGDCSALESATDEAKFRAVIAGKLARRDDFCDPAKHGFPFPWSDDLFLTDCTYAFFDGAVQFTYFHHGWIRLDLYLSGGEAAEAHNLSRAEDLPKTVKAPSGWDRTAPDSIIAISAGAA